MYTKLLLKEALFLHAMRKVGIKVLLLSLGLWLWRISAENVINQQVYLEAAISVGRITIPIFLAYTTIFALIANFAEIIGRIAGANNKAKRIIIVTSMGLTVMFFFLFSRLINLIL